jgi:hypothetical protein
LARRVREKGVLISRAKKNESGNEINRGKRVLEFEPRNPASSGPVPTPLGA